MHVTDYVNGEFLGANCIPLPQLYLRELTRPSSAEGLVRETKKSVAIARKKQLPSPTIFRSFRFCLLRSSLMLILGDERGCVAVVMAHRFTACGGSDLSTKLPILVYSLLVRALARTSAFICASSPV